MEVRSCILKRRSIRKFKQLDVSNEIIRDLLECAMAAPSACNKQPWEFYVIKNPTLLEKVKQIGKYTNFNSPCVIIVCGNRERTLSKRENDFFIQDCSAAIENILLRSTSLGLGTVWCGIMPMEMIYQKAKEVLELPEHIEPLGMIHVGYPDEEKEERTQYKEDYVHMYE